MYLRWEYLIEKSNNVKLSTLSWFHLIKETRSRNVAFTISVLKKIYEENFYFITTTAWLHLPNLRVSFQSHRFSSFTVRGCCNVKYLFRSWWRSLTPRLDGSIEQNQPPRKLFIPDPSTHPYCCNTLSPRSWRYGMSSRSESFRYAIGDPIRKCT